MSRLTPYLPLLIWLLLVWVLLWGSLSPAVLASGVVVAVLALAASRLPPLPRQTHPRWHRLPIVLARFAGDLVRSSLQLAWTTIRRGPRTTSGVVAVPVRCASDGALTLAAHRLSLVPGTLVIDIGRERAQRSGARGQAAGTSTNMDREAGVLYLFVLDLRRPEDADRARRDAERGTADLLHALGADRKDQP